MPIARTRKTTRTGRPRRKRLPRVIAGPEGVSVSPRALNRLRNNADFEVLVRIGRIVNALGFTLATQMQSRDLPPSEQRRQSTRGLLLMSAYLWEAILVIEKLVKAHSGVYGDCPGFQRLVAVVEPDAYRRHKAIVEAIRNNVSFHLDHKMLATSASIAKLDQADDYQLLTTDYERRFFYVDIADEVDLVHLAEKFRGKRTRRASVFAMINEVNELTVEVMAGSNRFVMDLMIRMGLMPSEGFPPAGNEEGR